MSYELIALLMFATMMLMLMTGQRVFGAIGFVGAAAALLLWGDGGSVMPFSSAIKLMKWYPLLTLPMFIYMGYIMSESRIADDLYEMFHVWMGPVHGGLAIGTIGLMVIISAMNGLSVAGMAIGATIALPELLRRGYDKVMVTGVIQAGIVAGHPGAAQRGAGALRHDRAPAGWAALACRGLSGTADGRTFRFVHRDTLSRAATSRTAPIHRRAQRDLGGKVPAATRRHSSAGHLLLHDWPFRDGHHQPR